MIMLWQHRVAAHLDTFGVPLTSPVKSAQFERISDQRMN
jgi:hypothetical protein